MAEHANSTSTPALQGAPAEDSPSVVSGPARLTRRLILGAVPMSVTATQLDYEHTVSAGEAWRLRKRAFIDQVAHLHSNGRYVASRAMAMDLDPDNCTCIQLVNRAQRSDEPILHFRDRIRPSVTIVVARSYAYEHGPVMPDGSYGIERLGRG